MPGAGWFSDVPVGPWLPKKKDANLERARTFLAAIGTACLMLMAVESIRQTDNLKRVVHWIEHHVEYESRHHSNAETFLKQVKDLRK